VSRRCPNGRRLECFFEAVATVAGEAVSNARDRFALVSEDCERVPVTRGNSVVAVRLFEMLQIIR